MADFISHPLVKEHSIEARVYQEVLTARVLEKGNSLIVAPTALGKTVVAVLVAAHVLEKNPDSKVLVLAPTKPLAVQHHKSFRKLMNVEKERIELLTGAVQPRKRREIFNCSSIICATPQAIENDLLQGKIDLKKIGLLVFDEAHRAVGDYSYVFLAQRFKSKNPEGLILGLTASPGGRKEKIMDVCKNLFIKNVEIKSEEDLDVKPYTHEIELQWVKVELPFEFLQIKKLIQEFNREQVAFLKKIGFGRSFPRNYIRKAELFELQKTIRKQLNSMAEKKPFLFQAAMKTAALVKSTHSLLLLETQGTNALKKYFEKLEAQSKTSGAPKAVKFFLEKEGISKAIALTNSLYAKGIIHPKVNRLKEILSEQFKANPESRVIVFNHYREGTKFLESFLARFSGIKPKRFIGQALKGKDKGMTQKAQIEAIKDFEGGKFNCLLATSVAEEGLDLPSVDLVVFFEPVPSEIRSIQRRGRTGRLSKGKAIILMAKGTIDESYYWASVAKERKMHSTLEGLKKESLGLKKESLVREEQTTLLKFNSEAQDKILIYVDSREQASSAVRELSKREDVFLKLKQLEVGDFVLSNSVVVERKTVEDFLQSMIDGRLFSQLINMASNYEKPLMILEGNQKDLFSLRNIHPNAIKGAMSAIALDYHVPIIFTENTEETVSFLCLIAKREQLGKEKDIRLRIGRKGLTQSELQQFIVESLPNVGPSLAKNLLKKFGSVKKLFNASEKRLLKVEKIGEKKAKAIRKIIDAEFGKY